MAQYIIAWLKQLLTFKLRIPETLKPFAVVTMNPRGTLGNINRCSVLHIRHFPCYGGGEFNTRPSFLVLFSSYCMLFFSGPVIYNSAHDRLHAYIFQKYVLHQRVYFPPLLSPPVILPLGYSKLSSVNQFSNLLLLAIFQCIAFA